MEMHLFTELVGIQMLLMNALEPILRGEKMTQEQLAVLNRRVQTTKTSQAAIPNVLKAREFHNRSGVSLSANADGSADDEQAGTARIKKRAFAY
jgi:hypothetical protein